jgi:hypothetical protein
MDSPPTLSQQLRHVDQRERQRFASTHRAEVQVVYLINEITDTAASSLEIARAITACGIAALRYQAALRTLREVVSRHE